MTTSAAFSCRGSVKTAFADMEMQQIWNDIWNHECHHEEDHAQGGQHVSKRHLLKKIIKGETSAVHSLLTASRKLSTLGLLCRLKILPDQMSKSDENGRKPLSLLAYQGYLEGVSYLLTKFPSFADEPDHDEDGSYPIHSAVMGGHVEVVAEFLEKCPQTINQTNSKNQTILHVAALHSKTCLLKYLLETHGTSLGQALHAKDNAGATFVDYFQRNNAKQQRSV